MWANQWIVKVSDGNTEIAIQLLRDIEEILGANPTLAFLRIVEEKQDGELFIRVLRIFIETETITGAQEDALSYACANARKRSQQTCFICGNTINIQKWDKEDEEIDSSLITFIKLFDDSEFNNNFFIPAQTVSVVRQTVSRRVAKQQMQTSIRLIKLYTKPRVLN